MAVAQRHLWYNYRRRQLLLQLRRQLLLQLRQQRGQLLVVE
jgi:hypothetical protein